PPDTEPPRPPSVADIPPIPEPQVFTGFGAHQVMSDPLPSGLAYGDVATAYQTAKDVADWVAAGSWDTLRSRLPNDATLDDASFEFRYGPIDKMSLMLLDAVLASNGGGFDFTLGAISNDVASNSTTLWCLDWYADAPGFAVVHRQEVLDQWPQLISVEAFRNNPELVANLSVRCQ
ncbi:MAG TPA: hypothetical protein PLV68_21015, partial [Ilumatobacteraceae bacterium]|nr:hypothetical protein [Ilumatobacteraceae bacterium]